MWWFIRALLKRFSRFKGVKAALREREDFEQKNRQEIWDYQLNKFNELWHFSCSNVPYYRDLQAQLNLPSHFYSLEEISQKVPILDKSIIQKNRTSLVSEKCTPGFWTGTSGSTGTPMRCYWSDKAYIESQRDKYYCQNLWGVDVWDKTANLWGYLHFFSADFKGKIGYIKNTIKEKIRNKVRFSAYQVNPKKLRGWFGLIRQKKVRFLYALPSLAYLLAKANEGRRPPKHLKLVMVGGEPLFPHQHQLIAQVLGCPVAIEYGTIEAGLIAASYPDSNLHVCERGVFLEAVPTSNGFFELVLTNLRNKDFPLIRYKIGDLVKSPISFPERGTAILGPVIGRVRDVFVSPSGNLINGVVLSEFFREFPEIIQYQVIQETLNHVVVQLVCWQPLLEESQQKIKLKFIKILGPQTKIDLYEVANLETTPANKHRFIISKVDVESLNILDPLPR